MLNRKRQLQLFICIIIYTQSINAIIQIYTTIFRGIDFIELQYKTFKKFLIDEFEYIVFYDNLDENLRIATENCCKLNGIRCINAQITPRSFPVPDFLNGKHTFTPAFRQGDIIHFAFKTLGFYNNDIIMLVDSDIFLTKEFSIRKYLVKNDFAANFMDSDMDQLPLPQLVFFNMSTLPHKETMIFRPGILSYKFFNTFSFMKFYFAAHPELTLKKIECPLINELWDYSENTLIEMGFTKLLCDFIKNYKSIYNGDNNYTFGFYDKTFISYQAGSNDNCNLRKNFLIDFINKNLLTDSSGEKK